jgi:hypothetical protein
MQTAREAIDLIFRLLEALNNFGIKNLAIWLRIKVNTTIIEREKAAGWRKSS